MTQQDTDDHVRQIKENMDPSLTGGQKAMIGATIGGQVLINTVAMAAVALFMAHQEGKLVGDSAAKNVFNKHGISFKSTAAAVKDAFREYPLLSWLSVGAAGVDTYIAGSRVYEGYMNGKTQKIGESVRYLHDHYPNMNREEQEKVAQEVLGKWAEKVTLPPLPGVEQTAAPGGLSPRG